VTGLSAVFTAGLALLAAAAAVDLAAGVRWPRLLTVPYLLGAAGSVCLAVTGAGALAGHPARLGVGGGWLGAGWLGGGRFGVGWLGGGWAGAAPLGRGTLGLAADKLSGLFLVIAFVAAAGVSLAFANWAARPGAVGRRGLGASYALALGAIAVFMTATDAFTALFAWETLTVSFYLLAGFERGKADRPGGALVTLIFGRISGAALLVGLLLLAAASHSLSLASFTQVSGGATRDAAQALLMGGFAVKVGLVPFQVWMPRGYSAAPGPARAIMAGVGVNVGFYGLWRTLALLGPPPAWLTGLILVLAGLTALLGIAHAAVQPGLQRVIAYSSVENTGLIVAGFGVALVGAASGDRRLVAAGLLAATLQIVAHTAAKSLLFTTSAMIESAAGTNNLDLLNGTARLLPWSGTGLAIGSLTLAGLPLTAGFVSEWFLLESLMQQFRVPGLGFRLVLAVAGAAVALTAGFAGVTFVRLVGLVVLGPRPAWAPGLGAAPVTPAPSPVSAVHSDPYTHTIHRADLDYGWLGRAGIVVLAAGCLVTAALVPLVIRVIAAGLSPVVPAAVTAGALKSPWVVQPVFAGFSILSPSWLWIVMPSLLVVVVAFTRLVSGTRMTRVRRVPAWRSATVGVEGTDSYTASGFANPTRRVLAAVLHTRVEVRPVEVGPAEVGLVEAGAHRHGPHLGYTSDVIEVVETYLYRPAVRPVMAVVRTAKRLQSGRLDAYLAYMLIALIALIALVIALA
jgi:formate hydrogenlyase subunit 3/multisubunit Na+/H+ antiporter MnhD subunit